MFDSVLDEPMSTESARTLRFGGPDDVAVTASITREPEDLQAAVEIQPARRYDIEVMHPDTPASFAETDVEGRARISGLPAALTSMRICPRGGGPAEARRTAWVPF